jgi:vacuolar protein sorting-associated protein 13A/C
MELHKVALGTSTIFMTSMIPSVTPGRISLGNLRLKKGALDKFRLPVDVLEGRELQWRLYPWFFSRSGPGYLGTFTLSLHWMNLGNQPVEILIENVYLLVVPSPLSNVDPEEEEQRAQAAKAERLESAELLHMQDQTAVPAGND